MKTAVVVQYSVTGNKVTISTIAIAQHINSGGTILYKSLQVPDCLGVIWRWQREAMA